VPLFEAEGVVAFLLVGLWLYCIFDVIACDSALARNLPKMVWLLIVLLLPDVGSIAWLLLGRPERASWRPGDTNPRRPRPRPTAARGRGPDDDDSFLNTLSPIVREREEQARLRMWEAQLKRREEELRRKEAGEEPSGGPA